MASHKKRVLLVSNFSLANTGFAKASKTLLEYLWGTGKYEIAQMCIGGVYPYDEKDFPKFTKTPWKNYGSLPKGMTDISSLENDKERSKIMAYGYYAIDEVVKDFKPDHVIFSEDPWAGGNLHQKPWWDKINCLFWTTLDSLPILPLALEQARHMKNYAVWADFAKKGLEEADPTLDIETIYAPVPLDNYHPKGDSLEARRKFGIQDDEFVVFMNSRNQLRKYFYSNIEACAILNKKFDNKIKFLVNTDVSERGWDLMSQVKEYGLKEENFLCSYVCNECSSFHIGPYQGNGLRCQSCGAEKSVHFPSVRKGLKEEDLNCLYNIADYYSLPISSGGFEMTILEALSAGLRVGTVDYSCCSNFEDAPAIDYYNYNFYREISSGFLKASVFTDSIVEKITDVINKNGLGFQHKVLENCEYAKNKFNHLDVCQKIENWIIKNDAPDFDFELIKEQVPNLNVPYESKEELSDSEYVEELYSKILNRPSDPKGLKDWVKTISRSSREYVHNCFIKIGKDIDSSKSKNLIDFIEDNDIPKIAIASSNGLLRVGDILEILESLLDRYPKEEYEYYLIADTNSMRYYNHYNFLKNIPYFELSKEKGFIESDHVKDNFFKFISLDNLDNIAKI